MDWDGLQLAPRERDLLFVAGPERARFFVDEAARVADRGLTVS